MNIIDISHHQGTVNFEKVKNAGYEGVIIKAGGSDDGFYKDNKFEEYYQGAKSVGLHIGSYYYVGKYCLSEQDGIEDAVRFADILNGKQFDLPVYMDVEAPASGQKDKVTNAIIGFCNEMENRGYYVGVYASDISGFKERIDLDRIKDKYDLWVARYGSKPQYVTNYQIWQYSGSGTVAGINDNQVDLDECYVDYPTIIINGGFNGYSNEQPTPQPTPQPQKRNDEIADEVINGLWGNGDERKNRLEEAGYNYNEIQNIVNQKLGGNGYYPRCNSSYYSLVDALESINVNSSYEFRKKIANANGIYNYTGTSTQNNSLLAKLKAGKLKRP